jgi:RNA polymerase sigma-70 factor (ECF subfamily)
MIDAEDRAPLKAPAGPGPVNSADKETTPDRYGSPAVDWSLLVQTVKAGKPEGLEQFYRLFARGIRFHICRQLGPQDLDDRVHDTFLVVIQTIQRGDLREPDRLMGFVRTIVRRQIATYIAANINSRHEKLDLETGSRLLDVAAVNPETKAISHEKRELIERILARMNDRDRQILTRFYLYEQSPEQICEEMDLSFTQFRLLKSRAKTRFGELGRKKVQRSTLTALFMRTSATA